MNERGQFIRKICEEPWRDDVRLVYSDWLEEQGEVDRAEFIRTQVELHRLEHYVLCHLPGQRMVDWCNATTRLGLTHSGKYWEFRRGFVHTVRCRLTDWFGEECANQRHVTGGEITEANCPDCKGKEYVNAHGPAIAACQPVERVKFADKEPSTYQSPYRNRWSWFNTEVPGTDRNDCLPERVLRLLEGFDNRGATPNMVKWYNSQEDAIAALSNAAVNWARREAGLPELKFLPAGLASAGESR